MKSPGIIALAALGLSLAGLLGPRGGAAASAQSARAPFTVDIPVLVLDHRGVPIGQLDQDLFRLSDNGRPQKIVRFDSQAHPVSLAIVVDTSDRDAIAQAKRTAQLLTAMVVGDAGEASVYIAGPDPHQVLAYTRDQTQLASTLQHLAQTPIAPLDQGQITRPANLALLDLTHRPSTQSRAVLVIAKTSDRSGAQALVEAALQQAIPIFRVSPRPLDNAPPYVNPDSTAVGGTGQGSQRNPNVLPNDSKPGMPGAANTDMATVNLTPLAHAAGAAATAAAHVVADPHTLDYVYDSGGLELGSGDNAEFDRQLSSIGADLRNEYHIFFHPDDLALSPSRRHQIEVTVMPSTTPVGRLAYRRAYLGPGPQ